MEAVMKKSRYSVLAFLCVFVGMLLILENYDYITGVYKVWPLFPLIVGLGLYLLYRDRGRKDYVVLAMGVYLMQFSGLAFYENFTSWAGMAYLWPFFIGFLGVSFLSIYISSGKGTIFLHLTVFLTGLCVVFFLVFSIDPRLWPISLVLFGISIFLIKTFNKGV